MKKNSESRLRRWAAIARRAAPCLYGGAWMGSGYIPYDYVVRQLSIGGKQDEWPSQQDIDDLTWEVNHPMPADIADIDKW